jgi:hypothetical protein
VTSRTPVLVARAQRLAVSLLAVSFLLAPTAVGASTRPRDSAGDAEARVASAQRAAGAQADRYMRALNEFERVKTQATGVEAAIGAGEQRAATLKRIVQQRAARAYMRAGSSLPSILKVGDVADMMRSDKLLATANTDDADAMSLLNAQQQDLRVKREDLRRLESEQGSALTSLKAQSRRADALLASALHNRAGVRARLAAQAAANRAAQASSRTQTRRASPIVAVRNTPAPPPPSSGGGGGAPSGNEFLSCVKQRESRGNYSVVNPAGPWYGAYQFLASTWNVTAQHAGRLDLVGVIPSQASPADQDAMALALYQWQGTGPWGGSCP